MLTLKILLITLLSGITAQGIKVISYFIEHKKVNFKRFFETGGMPSSHSSTSSTLTTLVGFYGGFNSLYFSIAAFFSFVIMYDAAGLRRAAGKQAMVLNKIVEDFQIEHRFKEKRLMELLGHTPLEVFYGALLGILIAIVFK